MSSTGKSGSRMIEINTQHAIKSVLFAEDGKQVLSGGKEMILRRWRVEDGQEVGEPIRPGRAEIYAAALSPDGKWLVCGLMRLNSKDGKAYVSVWDAQTQKKVLDIHGHTDTVFSVDISPDSTKFATGGSETLPRVFIWSLTTGESLVGPLEHDGWAVVAVRFSPSGNRIATATGDQTDTTSIRIYDSNSGQQLLNIPCWFCSIISSPLAWSADGHRLFAATSGEAKCFDTSSGALLNKWAIPDAEQASIVLSRNEKFAVTVTDQSLLFWDTSTHQQIGTVIELASESKSVALSPNDDCVVTGEENGTVTIHGLRDILPSSYLTVNLPLMNISDSVFKSWKQGDLTRVEELLTTDIVQPSGTLHHARTLAYRALVRSRSKHWDIAIDDAKKSIDIQPSIIGYLANAVAHLCNGEHELAMRIFDLVFIHGLSSENKFLLLIKAIILFKRGRHDDAILRVGDLIDFVDDHSPYITVRAQMLFLLGSMSMRGGDNKRAIELFKRAQEAIPFQQSSYLVVISLMFGWDFERLAPMIQLQLWKAMHAVGHTEVSQPLSVMIETLGEDFSTDEVPTAWDPDIVQKCLTTFETNGDVAVESKDPTGAIIQYSTALYLNPSNPVGLLVKRSNARTMLGLWEDALRDADDAIKTDSSSPWGYERRHAALHGLQRYDEAITAFSRMVSLIESSLDQAVRRLGKKYVSPSRSEMMMNIIIRGVLKVSPLVLIDVKSGRLCDVPERTNIFKSEPQFKEMVSSMTRELDNTRIQQVAEEYFRYVTLSHVWQGKEPSFQDVNQAGSVWELDSSPLNDKLGKFCEVVRSDGYRWAWSDTCCIDKTISSVLNQSLTMMYKWYEASAATFILLEDVASPSALGDLTDSMWMLRAWTAQELLAATVIRFYNRDWKPYLGDIRSNHKDSPEIMQELANAIGIARNTIIAFNPNDLTVREKLRLASKRNATVEEDIAYSLIGIFKSDIRPHYGEGDAALGHLLEEIISRSGDLTVLAWTGKSSLYNSCLPVSLEVYSQPPGSSLPITDTEINERTTTLRNSLSHADAVLIHDRVTSLPPARFATRRLHLPCIIFAVRQLGMQDFASGQEISYRARVLGIGDVEFQTADRLPLAEPRKLIFVHPWIRELRDPLDGFTRGITAEDDIASDAGSEFCSAPSSPLFALPTAAADEDLRALRLIVRLQQPFHALLLQQQPNGEFKRVAAEHEIVVPGIKRLNNFAGDMRAEVVEIL